ncbi:enoyl-CoA hydratase/isomerase family protein [uncultured Dysosmobacter sp.]|uniref:enoyl-CoA hydratase/isomerase family protein n=1 Tax=uncultured Dysosmobacter sp. TaxID=2591384 RepID=UPI00260E210A|nr:enoyl-CoA hydratase-related protein [uncultured Dysosmobacter sp.]
MKFDTIKVELEEELGIATITINKPPVNALGSDDYGELYEALYKLSKNKAIRVLILTAEGEKLFVGGSDVKEFTALDGETGPLYTERNNNVRAYLYNFPKPVICALNGSAFGGGVGLAICCDIRLCVPEAKFNLGEINMGILGLTQHFTARCFNGTARKMVYTGERITATEAMRIGLVDEILTREDLLPRARQIAKEIASKSPLAIQYAKQCMIEAEKNSLDKIDFEAACIGKLWATEDKNEATSSFLEKREPVFKGR